MIMKKIILAIILGITFVSASISPTYAEGEEEITILFTHDLHDNLYSFPVANEDETTSVGGFARLATAIEQERQDKEHTLLLDAGDYAMGTLFQTIFSTESPALRMLGEFGYDAVTFGN